MPRKNRIKKPIKKQIQTMIFSCSASERETWMLPPLTSPTESSNEDNEETVEECIGTMLISPSNASNTATERVPPLTSSPKVSEPQDSTHEDSIETGTRPKPPKYSLSRKKLKQKSPEKRLEDVPISPSKASNTATERVPPLPSPPRVSEPQDSTHKDSTYKGTKPKTLKLSPSPKKPNKKSPEKRLEDVPISPFKASNTATERVPPLPSPPRVSEPQDSTHKDSTYKGTKPKSLKLSPSPKKPKQKSPEKRLENVLISPSKVVNIATDRVPPLTSPPKVSEPQDSTDEDSTETGTRPKPPKYSLSRKKPKQKTPEKRLEDVPISPSKASNTATERVPPLTSPPRVSEPQDSTDEDSTETGTRPKPPKYSLLRKKPKQNTPEKLLEDVQISPPKAINIATERLPHSPTMSPPKVSEPQDSTHKDSTYTGTKPKTPIYSLLRKKSKQKSPVKRLEDARISPSKTINIAIERVPHSPTTSPPKLFDPQYSIHKDSTQTGTRPKPPKFSLSRKTPQKLNNKTLEERINALPTLSSIVNDIAKDKLPLPKPLPKVSEPKVLNNKTPTHNNVRFNPFFAHSRKEQNLRILEENVEALTTALYQMSKQAAEALTPTTTPSKVSESQALTSLRNLIKNRDSLDTVIRKHVFDKLKESNARNEKIFEVLVETNCPLDFAVELENAEVLRMLLQHQRREISDKDCYLLLSAAMASTYLENLKVVLKYGPDVMTRRYFFFSVMCELVKNPTTTNDLAADIEAAKNYIQNLMIARVIDQDTVTFVEQTFEEGPEEAVKLLLDCGMVEYVKKYLNEDIYVHLFGNKNLNMVEYYQKTRCDVNGNCGGMSALHFATLGMLKDNVHLLLGTGANPNAKDCNGMTPLFAHGDAKSITLLLHNGADVQAIANDGRTVLHMLYHPMMLGIFLADIAIIQAQGVELKAEICKQIVSKPYFMNTYCQLCNQLEKLKEVLINDHFSVWIALVRRPEVIARFVNTEKILFEMVGLCRYLGVHRYYLWTFANNVDRAYTAYGLKCKADETLLTIFKKFDINEKIVKKIVDYMTIRDLFLYR